MSDGNKWITPSTLMGAIGMLGAVGAAWMTLDGRITKVEAKTESAEARLERIENKLDRLIERGGVR